jgi:hypothetical protein
VNQLVGGQLLGSPTLVYLADPVGLYIQLPQNPGAFAFGPNIVPGKEGAGRRAADRHLADRPHPKETKINNSAKDSIAAPREVDSRRTRN